MVARLRKSKLLILRPCKLCQPSLSPQPPYLIFARSAKHFFPRRGKAKCPKSLCAEQRPPHLPRYAAFLASLCRNQKPTTNSRDSLLCPQDLLLAPNCHAPRKYPHYVHETCGGLSPEPLLRQDGRHQRITSSCRFGPGGPRRFARPRLRSQRPQAAAQGRLHQRPVDPRGEIRPRVAFWGHLGGVGIGVPLRDAACGCGRPGNSS